MPELGESTIAYAGHLLSARMVIGHVEPEDGDLTRNHFTGRKPFGRTVVTHRCLGHGARDARFLEGFHLRDSARLHLPMKSAQRRGMGGLPQQQSF